jgi:fengycin family lipopeptide synthetase D
MHKAFNKKIDVRNLFQYPTIAELSRLLAEKEAVEFIRIEPQSVKPYYELSYNQKRIWILQKLNPGSSVFNIPVRVTLEPSEPGEYEAIKKVLAALAARHESFRTGFKGVGEAIAQVIQPGMEAGLPVEEIDLTHLPVEEANARRQELFLEESALLFDIDTGPLWRVKLVIFKNGCDLILNMHHLISDGWSMDILRQEFGVLYHVFKEGEDNPLKPLRIQYKDYAAWYNRLLTDRERMKEAVEFWKQQLSGDIPVLKLPYNYHVPEDTVPANHDYLSSPWDYENIDNKKLSKQKFLRGSRGQFFQKEPPGRRRQKSAGYRVVVTGSVVEGLRSIAFTHHASLFMVLLAGFNMFLSILRGQEDIVLAIPGAARQHEDLKNIVGLFVNTLIIRTQVNPGETFGNFLNRVRENTSKVLEYQSYPLELICEELNIQYPKIPVFLNMLNIGSSPLASLADSEIESYHLDQVQDTKFDMVCYLTEYQNGIEIMCHYFRNLFRPAAIEKMIKFYVRLLESIAGDPNKLVKDYHKSDKPRKFKRQ